MFHARSASRRRSPGGHDVDNHLRHAQHVEPVTRRRRVENDDVVFRRAVAGASRWCATTLCRASPIRACRGLREKKRGRICCRRAASRARSIQHQRAVLFERDVGRHVHRPNVAPTENHFAADQIGAEHRREALFRVAHRDEHALAFRRERHRLGRADGRLSDAAFAGHDEKALVRRASHLGYRGERGFHPRCARASCAVLDRKPRGQSLPSSRSAVSAKSE